MYYCYQYIIHSVKKKQYPTGLITYLKFTRTSSCLTRFVSSKLWITNQFWQFVTLLFNKLNGFSAWKLNTGCILCLNGVHFKMAASNAVRCTLRAGWSNDCSHYAMHFLKDSFPCRSWCHMMQVGMLVIRVTLLGFIACILLHEHNSHINTSKILVKLKNNLEAIQFTDGQKILGAFNSQWG